MSTLLNKKSKSNEKSPNASLNQQTSTNSFSIPNQVSLKVANLLENHQLLASLSTCHQTGRILATILQQVSLSEVESVCWLILIEKSIIYETCVDLYHYLLFTAMKSKELLGCKIKNIIQKFRKLDKNFKTKYFEWIKSHLFLEVNVKEINKKFDLLGRMKTFTINYNFYIDSILVGSNGYRILKKVENFNIDVSTHINNEQAENVYWDFEDSKTNTGFLLDSGDIYFHI